MRPMLTALCSLFLLAQAVFAQDGTSSLFQLKEPVSQGFAAPQVEVSAILVPTGQPGMVQLQVKMVLPPGGNSYSMDPSFPKPTKITLKDTGWTAVDPGYGINPPPKKEHDEIFDKVVEKLTGTVILSRRFTVPPGTNLSSASLSGKIDYLYCNKDSCLPKSAEFTASVPATRKAEDLEPVPGETGSVSATTSAKTPEATPKSTAEPLAPVSMNATPKAVEGVKQLQLPKPIAIPALKKEVAADSTPETSGLTHAYTVVPQKVGSRQEPIEVQFELSPAATKAGDKVTLAVTISLPDNWSTYALDKADDTQIEIPTSLQFKPSNLVAVGTTVSVPQPVVHTTQLQNEARRSNVHDGRVTWKQEFEVLENGPIGLSGSVRFQTCEKSKSCLPPKVVEFWLGSEQQSAVLGAAPIVASYLHASAEASPKFVVESAGDETTLWGAMSTAFLAGLLMNIMPCVLPVLAIKILSFVQQAGEKRGRILALNFAYTAGVMIVFMIFAFLSVVLGKSLGAVFQNTPFMISMACVVFVMGLSLFGVFELPVPGIIPSAGHHHEGYLGAINTGIIATFLGTPCIAPFVATVFTWGLSQPPVVVFGMFGLMGLGMAFPFLLTAVFPSMVNWLPRPGLWMVKFKQFTGFVMMGTVIWLLFNVEMEWRVPVLVILLGLALFVWLCANLTTPAHGFFKRTAGCVLGALIALPVVWSGLWLMAEFKPSDSLQHPVALHETPEEDGHKMPWEPFSEDVLVKLRSEGKPMLIDFTANWCVICKVNEKVALDRAETVKFVKANGIVPMMADFTKENPEILKYLRLFGQDSVPLTVIIPPGANSKVIAIRGQYTKSILMDKLQEAVGTVVASEASPVTPTMGAALGVPATTK